MVSTEMIIMREIDQETIELRERNQQRAEEAKLKMGKKFVLHPANSPRKIKEKRALK